MIVVLRRHMFFWAVLFGIVLLWATPLVYRIDIGKWDAAVVRSFYDSEYGAGTTFRWSKPASTLAVPALGVGAYQLSINASAVTTTALDITVNGITDTVLVHPGFAQYTVPVVVPFSYSDVLSVTLTVSQPITHDRRTLGVALDEVRFIPYGWLIPSWSSIWWSLLATGILTYLLRWSRVIWMWRWLIASSLVGTIIVIRHGDATTIFELITLIGGISFVSAHCVRLTRYQQLGMLAMGVVVAVGMLVWHGIDAWAPLWQLLFLLGSTTILRLRRFVWRVIRPYRHSVFGVALVFCASQAWLLAGLSMLLATMYVVGKRVDPNRGMGHAVLFAGYSLFPLLDAWLSGRGITRGPQKQILRYIGLDYLRGIAMLMVLFTHMPTVVPYTPAWFFETLAWVGKISVDAFFILSGWLIGGLIINEIPHWKNTRALGLFLHRRWARTIPIYWFMLVLVALGGWGGASIPHMAEYFVFVQNMWHNHPPYLLVSWSLSIEEWFYLLTALGISLMVRWYKPQHALFITLMLLLIVPSVLRSYLAITTQSSWNDVLRQYIPLRIDVIGSGVAMVWWWRTWPKQNTTRATRLVIVSIAMTLVYLGFVVWFRPDIDRDVWIRVSLIPMTVLALALWYPWLSTITRTHLSLLGRLVQWIAWISYPLYLLHYPWRLTIEGLVGAIGRNPVVDVIVTVGYLVGAVWLAGRWHVELEQPIMHLRIRT